ncbi:hypothetical protein V6Z11_D09G196400 [Gossypium hirsutum]
MTQDETDCAFQREIVVNLLRMAIWNLLELYSFFGRFDPS